MKKYSFSIRLCWILLGFCQSVGLSAQLDNALVAHFNFDSCTVNDHQNKAQAASVGPLNCVCGTPGKAIAWNGGLNFAEWNSSAIQSLFNADFTVSFYFMPDQVTGTMDILSKRENCGIDSFFAIRYVADQRTLVADVVQRVDNNGTVKAVLPANTCWFHIVFVKAGNRLSLFVNGQEKDTRINNYTITVQNKAKLQLANSPCLSISDIRFKGGFDELRLYNKALTLSEVKSLYSITDHILNKDTVIFKGGKVNVRLSQTCALNYTWSPSAGVTNPSTGMTSLAPTVTTTYSLTSTQGNCIIRDTLKVTVIDPSMLDCNQVRLPTAFTPNQDGLNDLYRITNPYVTEAVKNFEIFDRWGERLYSTSDAAGGWDGTFRNTPVNPGLFVYHLTYTCKGQTKHKSGSFALIR